VPWRSLGSVSTTLRPVLPVAPTIRMVGAMLSRRWQVL
jgi:hypothetical protein